MRTLVLISLIASLLGAHAAYAGDLLLQQSAEPTCFAYVTKYGQQMKINGYATVRRANDGNVYERNCDFMGKQEAASFSDIGMPLDGFPNTASRGEATKVRMLRNGHLQLY